MLLLELAKALGQLRDLRSWPDTQRLLHKQVDASLEDTKPQVFLYVSASLHTDFLHQHCWL